MKHGRAFGALAALVGLSGCGGGTPLLHPARTLQAGDVTAAGGVSANIATAGLDDDLQNARAIATRAPDSAPGAPGSNPAYAKGALVAAAIAPGLAPFVAARVGIGSRFEGGLGYTGRGVRVDVRRSFDSGPWSLSLGLGGSATLYGRQQGSDLPNVDLAELHGYGGDLPILVGWESTGGLYQVWAGVRGGVEHVLVAALTSEPVPTPSNEIHLDATRFYGGGLFGISTGFKHIHVSLELDVAFQTATGSYNDNHVSIHGLTLAPAAAIGWSF